MPAIRTGALTAAGIAAVLALGACGSSKSSSSPSTSGGGSTSPSASATKGPIVIGAAVDDTSFMRPTDQPPLAAARLEAAKINAAGGVDGRRIEFKVINTQLDPARTRAAATQLTDSGAQILWVTCDVDLSTPSIQVGLAKQMLTVSPCIGTDQMGPRRFGAAGKLAFSFGNVAQDEGAAMARAAIDKGWRTSNLISDRALVYTQNVCQAFQIAFERMGGRVLDQETFTSGDNTIGGVVSKVNKSQAAVDTICTTTGRDLPTFVTGLRGLGNATPILGPWSIDGTFWLPRSTTAADNIHYVTFASIFGDDPDPNVRALIAAMTSAGQTPVTGGFLTGPETVDAIAQVIRENNGSTDGTKLAASMEALRGFRTPLGTISFSPSLHTVFGRTYREIDITRGRARLGEEVRADAPVTLP